MSRRKIEGQGGYGLLGNVILLGAVVTVAGTTLEQMSKQVRLKAVVAQEANLEEVRSFIRNAVDCRATVDNAAALCGTTTKIPVLDHAGMTIITNDEETRLGEHFGLRAFCDDQASGTLRFEVARFKNESPGTRPQFASHPVTGRPSSWTNLFGDIPMVCPSAPAAVACIDPPVDGTVTLDSNQIRNRFNTAAGSTLLPADASMLGDDFHAELICNLSGYEQSTAFIRGGCTSARTGIWRWYKEDFDFTGTCYNRGQLLSVTCRYQRPCNAYCPSSTTLTNDIYIEDVAASHVGDIGHAVGGNLSILGTGVVRNPYATIQANQLASRTELCRLRGYARAVSYSSSSYSSCANNLIASFNAGTSAWSVLQACTAGNSSLSSITCDTPIAGECSRRFRVHP